MDKIIFGRFLPGNTYVHKMDPRAKLLFVFGFIVVVFLANNTITYSILIGITLFVMLLARIKPSFLINGLKPVVFLLIFTFLLHLFFTREGDLLWEWGILKIYEGGLRQGIYIAIRFAVLVIMTSFLTLTTSPIDRKSTRLNSSH